MTYQLDASAVLAVLQGEPGREVVVPLLSRSRIHSFNLAEVYTKLRQKGLPNPETVVGALELEIEEKLTASNAAAIAALHAETRDEGFAMGDCLCLAMAEANGSVALTADREWVEVMRGSGIEVQCIRPPKA